MAYRDMNFSLYAYNRWANQRILDTAENLTWEQFLMDVGASFPSVRDTLVHTMVVQNNWLYRFQRLDLPPAKEFDEFPDLAAIIRAWEQIDAATESYVLSLSESDVDETIEYVNSIGNRCRYQRWQMMAHQVNHATQHRSEVAVMLTQFGYSPGALDYLVYVDQFSV